MIGEHSVLPTVCALAWMSSSVESIYAGYQVVSTHNYRLFKGIVFDGTECDEYLIDMELVDQADESLVLEVKVSSHNSSGKTIYHYAAQLQMEPQREPVVNLANYQLSEMQASAKPLNGSSSEPAKELYLNGTLFHGKSLQGIRDVISCDDSGLLLSCQVPQIALLKQGDFDLVKNNIFANDLVFQAMLVWVKKQLKLGSLPSATKNWTVYRQIAIDELFYLKLEVVAQNKTKILADIQLISTDNTLIAFIEAAEVTASENLNRLFDKNNLASAEIG